MAEVQRLRTQESNQPKPIPKPSKALQIPPPSLVTLPPPSSASRLRDSHLNHDAFSPVNQNGSYDFDRVLKSGFVQKRTRKTKAWKSIYLVLRPNYLSIYKDEHEDKLRHKIILADLTAVAFLKDPKHKRENVLGLFSPSRNYHLEAKSQKDAEEWVELIRREARIEEEEEEMMLASPGGYATETYSGFERSMQQQYEQRQLDDDRLGSSSPEPSEPMPRMPRNNPRTAPRNAPAMNTGRRASHTMEYSGNEFSDISDADVTRARGISNASVAEEQALRSPGLRPVLGGRNVSQLSLFNLELDPERVCWQGHLLYLKYTGGVRQWKDLWIVLRPKNIAMYKNDSEYSPILILPLSSVINVVEIDALSKTKTHCLQIITEEKSYKFCAPNEDTLDKSLGAFKSLLAKRKEQRGR